MTWYVLRSKQHKENALWHELQARGFEVYYPRIKVKPVNPRAHSMRPYFPGYLFLSTDQLDFRLPALKWMPFSLGLVTFDNKAAEVPETIVHALRRHEEEKNKASGSEVSDLKRGDPVMIRDERFSGYEAVFDACLSGSDRVRVLIKLLRDHQKALELPAKQICKKTH